MKRRNLFSRPVSSLLFAVMGLSLVFTSCDDEDGGNPIVKPGPTGAVSVTDQFIAETDNMVVVEEVTLSHDGWVVVHRGDGSNAPIVPDIISEPKFLTAGTYQDVMIELKEDEVVALDEQLWVMLHDDSGQEEVYEFVGGSDSPDQPILDSGKNIVMASFMNSYTFTENTENTMYALWEVNGSGVSGIATIYKAARGEGAYVVLDLEGTSAGGNHPAHIHENSVEEGGPVAVPLTNVNGEDGMSVTFVNSFTYDELIAYNGHINVHLSPEDMATYVAQGDIGANASPLTGESVTYNLEERAVEGVSGTATLWEMEDGSTLVKLMLENTSEDGMHPAHIHVNSAAEGGGVAVSLNPVNGKSGQSFTHVTMFNEGSPDRAGEMLTYEELLEYNGYINVHLSSSEMGTIVAQGDIGGNELTGEMTEYPLMSMDEATDVNGTVSFMERKNGNTLVVIQVENTVAGMEHPAHIHEGDVESNGAIAISLNPVNGDSGISMTNVRAFNGEGMEMNGGEAVTYAGLLEYDGYVNIHLSAEQLATVVASGEVGAE